MTETSFWKTIHEIMAAGGVDAQTTSPAVRRKSRFGYVLAGLGVVAAALWLNYQFRSNPAEEVKTITPVPPTTSAGKLPNDDSTTIPNIAAKPAANSNRAKKEKLNEPPVPVQMSGMLMITSQPLGAVIFLNDSLLRDQLTPTLIQNLAPGEYRLRVEKLGYRSSVQQVTLEPGKTAEVRDLVLEKLPSALLRIRAIPFADIYVDDILEATKAETSAVLVEAGRHFIKLVHSTLGTRLDTINARSAETHLIILDLRKH